jgi:phospholipase D1/2
MDPSILAWHDELTVYHVLNHIVRNYAQYKAFYPEPSLINVGHVWNPEMTTDEIRSHLRHIKGHLVEFPCRFLEEEDLKADALTLTLELYTWSLL